MQGAASVSNGLQHEPKTNGKIISSSTKNSDFKNSDQNSDFKNSNQLNENEEQWDWCKGLPPKSSEAFWQKKNASAYTLPKKNLTKVFNYYQKKANSESKLHTYVQNSRKMCALSAGACYFGKNKKYSKLWCFEKIAWVFIVYM